MEKKLNMNQYNEIKKAENVTLLSINPEVINEALKQGKIKVLAQHGNNIYYLCNSMRSNTVLMHINKNYYTVIDRFIDSENGKLVNTVKQLTKFSFFCVTTGSRRIHIMTNIPVNMQQEYGKKTDYLPRMLVSLEKYGEVLNLNKEYDVHHKGTNFDNRQKMMMYIPKCEHKHRKSHTSGCIIRTMPEFDILCVALKKQYNVLKNKTKVE